MKFYPYKNGGGGGVRRAETVLAMLKVGWGITQRFGVVLTRELEVLRPIPTHRFSED